MGKGGLAVATEPGGQVAEAGAHVDADSLERRKRIDHKILQKKTPHSEQKEV